MLDTILLPSLVVLAAAWTLVSFFRGQRAIAAGSLTTTATLALASLAAHLGFGPWMEGGYGMNVLAVCGSYTLGAAVASRFSTGHGPRRAALVGALLTLGASALFYGQAVSGVAEVVRHADPVTAARIEAAARAEAVHILELSGLIGVLTAALLFVRPRRGGGRLGAGGDRVVEPARDDVRLLAGS